MNAVAPTLAHLVAGWNPDGYFAVILTSEQADLDDPEARIYAVRGLAQLDDATNLARGWAKDNNFALQDEDDGRRRDKFHSKHRDRYPHNLPPQERAAREARIQEYRRRVEIEELKEKGVLQ